MCVSLRARIVVLVPVSHVCVCVCVCYLRVVCVHLDEKHICQLAISQLRTLFCATYVHVCANFPQYARKCLAFVCVFMCACACLDRIISRHILCVCATFVKFPSEVTYPSD